MEKELRRKAPRRHFDGQVGILYNGHMTITVCAQLGEGGALIKTDHLLKEMKEGDEMVVTMFLPNIGGLVTCAKCVYLTDTGFIGLQFSELEMKFKVRIREFVSRRKARENAK